MRAGSSGIVLQLFAQGLNLRLGFFQILLQRFFCSKRPASRARSHPHAIVSHTVERHESLRTKPRHALSQEWVQYCFTLGSKIRQRVVVDRDAATYPTVSYMLPAQFIQLARTTHAIQRCIQPQRQQNPRIDRGPPRVALHRFDCRIQLG